ncbi:MAG: hypothetical protein JW751_06705 [Polyangiaceae bacterium]|nr:hypothetical protein [Polyangiaceae bacterium]
MARGFGRFAVWLVIGSTIAGGCSKDRDAGSGGCPGAEVHCGDECVDTRTDTVHCGRCDHPCATDQACEAGTCVD